MKIMKVGVRMPMIETDAKKKRSQIYIQSINYICPDLQALLAERSVTRKSTINARSVTQSAVMDPAAHIPSPNKPEDI